MNWFLTGFGDNEISLELVTSSTASTVQLKLALKPEAVAPVLDLNVIVIAPVECVDSKSGGKVLPEIVPGKELQLLNHSLQ